MTSFMTANFAELDAHNQKPARLVTVALANKLARIIWAVKKTGESFRMEKFAKA